MKWIWIVLGAYVVCGLGVSWGSCSSSSFSSDSASSCSSPSLGSGSLTHMPATSRGIPYFDSPWGPVKGKFINLCQYMHPEAPNSTYVWTAIERDNPGQGVLSNCVSFSPDSSGQGIMTGIVPVLIRGTDGVARRVLVPVREFYSIFEKYDQGRQLVEYKKAKLLERVNEQWKKSAQHESLSDIHSRIEYAFDDQVKARQREIYEAADRARGHLLDIFNFEICAKIEKYVPLPRNYAAVLEISEQDDDRVLAGMYRTREQLGLPKGNEKSDLLVEERFLHCDRRCFYELHVHFLRSHLEDYDVVWPELASHCEQICSILRSPVVDGCCEIVGFRPLLAILQYAYGGETVSWPMRVYERYPKQLVREATDLRGKALRMVFEYAYGTPGSWDNFYRIAALRKFIKDKQQSVENISVSAARKLRERKPRPFEIIGGYLAKRGAGGKNSWENYNYAYGPIVEISIQEEMPILNTEQDDIRTTPADEDDLMCRFLLWTYDDRHEYEELNGRKKAAFEQAREQQRRLRRAYIRDNTEELIAECERLEFKNVRNRLLLASSRVGVPLHMLGNRKTEQRK